MLHSLSNHTTYSPDKLLTVMLRRLSMYETERVEELQLTCTEKVYNKMLHTTVSISQLSAGYIGIIS